MEQIFSPSEVILGVDTHLDIHVGVVIDQVGRVRGTHSIATNASGYKELLGWAQKFGDLKRAGIEGTSSYGAGLTRFLQANGVKVIETGPTACVGAAGGKAIRRTLKVPLALCWQRMQTTYLKRKAAWLKRYARSTWLAAARSRPRLRQSTSFGRCS